MFEPASRVRSLLSGYGLGLGGAIVGFGSTIVVGSLLTLANLGLGLLETFALSFLFIQLLSFVGIPLAYFRFRGMTWREIREYIGVRVPSLVEVGVIAAGLVGIFVLVAAASFVVQTIGAQPAENAAASQAQDAPEIIPFLILGMLLVVGPGEEMLFRGTVQNRLREGFPAWAAIPLTAVLFAAVHFPALGGGGSRLVTIAVLLVPSLVFGVIYEYTDNLVVPALTHGLWNSFLLSLVYLRQFLPA